MKIILKRAGSCLNSLSAVRTPQAYQDTDEYLSLPFKNKDIKLLVAASKKDKADPAYALLAADRGIYMVYRPASGSNVVAKMLGNLEDSINIAVRDVVGDGYIKVPIKRLENALDGTEIKLPGLIKIRISR